MAGATREIPTELGTKDIGKLLKQYAWPAIIAQVAASLYNMVDSIYIGHLSENAISGLAVTFRRRVPSQVSRCHLRLSLYLC